MKKKLLSVIAILLVVCTISACSSGGGSGSLLGKTQVSIGNDAAGKAIRQEIAKNQAAHPVYNRLRADEKDAYVEICATINAFEKSTSAIYRASSMKEAKDFGNKMTSLYREIVYEQSEVFWVTPYNCNLLIQETGKEFLVFIEPEYILKKDDALAKKKVLDQKIETIVTNANAKATTFDKILYVYDSLLGNCSYDKALIEDDDSLTTAITAYGCLVEGKTVCSGYALAFNAIMKRLGFECGVEFNNYGNFSILTGHVWNYCKIEDDYYYFDLTWDDTGFDSDKFKPYFAYSHQFFAITKDELEKTNFTLTPDAPTPPCNGTKYNYFVYNGYSFSEYDFEVVKAAILKQAPQGYAALRFDSYAELLQAESDLLNSGKIHSIVPGQSSITYVISDSSLYLYLFFKG